MGCLSSHTSAATRTWLLDHPRIHHAFIPTRACWLNMAEGWWRLLHKSALAGVSFADPDEITLAVRAATALWGSRTRSRALAWASMRPARTR
jgi:transposase